MRDSDWWGEVVVVVACYLIAMALAVFWLAIGGAR